MNSLELDKISVIVPVYNVSRYLDKCVSSLLNQKYQNTEIILVDDGSTDASGDMCDRYAKQDERIKVLHKQNAGLGFARNSGLKVASGKYVVFIDSDDYVEDSMLSALFDAAQMYNADTVIGGFSTVVDNDIILSKTKLNNEEFKNKEIMQCLMPRLIGSAPNKKDSIRMSVWNVLYSMDIIMSNGISFPSEREMISEDIIFDLKYYQYSRKTVLIDSCHYCYRITDGSLTTKYRPERFELSKKLHKELIRQIEIIGLDPNTRDRASRYFFILLRMCIRQEEVKVSGKNLTEAVKSIKSICGDRYVKKVIAEYPVDLLNTKQKVFISLIKGKHAVFLYLMINFMKRK